jgi:hypothetical protein
VEILRRIVVFDARDIEAESRFWAGLLGGRQLQAARRPADNPDGDELFAVYASPAGHPFCFGSH